MARRLKVYGWQGRRSECPGHHQTREIVAAYSKAEAARLAGYKRPRQMFNLCETGNHEEIAKALSATGTVFWSPLDDRGSRRKWTAFVRGRTWSCGLHGNTGKRGRWFTTDRGEAEKRAVAAGRGGALLYVDVTYAEAEAACWDESDGRCDDYYVLPAHLSQGAGLWGGQDLARGYVRLWRGVDAAEVRRRNSGIQEADETSTPVCTCATLGQASS